MTVVARAVPNVSKEPSVVAASVYAHGRRVADISIDDTNAPPRLNWPNA